MTVFLLILMGNSVLAIESFPEYKFFPANEEEIILASPANYDSEYQSDALAYTLIDKWDRDWIYKDSLLQFSAGSISSSRFNNDNRLKLTNNLAENWNFYFLYLYESNLDLSQESHLVEIEYNVFQNLSFSAYGELMERKSRDDVGFSANYFVNNHHRVRIFYNLSDFSRNERNESNDEFEESPRTLGIIGQWVRNNSFFQWVARYSPELKWSFPDDDFIYIAKQNYYGLKSRWELASNDLIGLEAHLHHRKEAIEVGLTSSQVASEVRFKRYELKSYMFHPSLLSPLWDFKWGFQWVQRIWSYEDSEIDQRNALPFLWFLHNVPVAGRTDTVGIGWESTYYESEGPEALRALTDKDYAMEQRLNLSYSLNFVNAEMRWMFTFDLDRFGSGETWEGGAGQMNWEF